MKKLFLIISILQFSFGFKAQVVPNDCSEAVAGCTTPNFQIYPPNAASNNFDFGTGTISNPSTNPNSSPGNSGCLLSGETSSTFITISVVSSGTLAWSMIGSTGSGCFDWIMWPYTLPGASGSSSTCAALQNATLPPVACNWNGTCNGNTGMAPAGSLPPGGSSSSYENPLNVVAGQNYLLCLSNYSSTSQSVNLNFFGTAQVACGVSAPNQTVCLGSSATVNIATPGYVAPTFQWLVTNGVSNTTSGSNVTVTPTVTTLYKVRVHQLQNGGVPEIIDTAEFTITVVPPPAPNAGIDDTVCLGSPILLHGQVASASNTVSWQTITTGISPTPTVSFSPNFSNLNPTVSVNQPGLYKFVLRESNTACGIYRDTVNVLVSNTTQTVSQISPSCSGVPDGQIIINNPDAVSYSFDNGLTWQASNTANTFIAGTYSVCSKNSLGCQTCSNITVVDPAPMTISVSNDTLICENGTAYLSAVANGSGAPFIYHWDHTSSLLANQSVDPDVNTYFYVRAENSTGCFSNKDSIYVTLRNPISGNISPDITICPGYPGSLNMNASGGIGSPYTIVWSTGQSVSGNQDVLTQSPSATTTYTVTVTDACESTPLVMNADMIVAPLPVPLIAVDAREKCEPASFVLTNLTNPAMVSGLIWNISNGETFIDQDMVITDTMPHGLYDVQLIVTSPDGCIDSVTWFDYLVSQPKPIADFRYSPNPIKMFNTQAIFTNYTLNADYYQWFIDQGSPSYSTQENPISIFPDGIAATYDVTLIAESAFGCSDTLIQQVIVYPEVLIYAPNTFTPDNDEHNQDWGIFIEGIDPYDFSLLIFDRWGEVVWESRDPQARWDGTYQGMKLKEGTYVWKIACKDMLNDGKFEFKGFINILR